MLLVERKNKRIRKAMAEYGLDQTRLEMVLGTNDTEVSVMLKRELAKSEQDDIIKAIADWKERQA